MAPAAGCRWGILKGNRMHIPPHCLRLDIYICVISIGIGIALARRSAVAPLLMLMLLITVMNDYVKYYSQSEAYRQWWDGFSTLLGLIGAIAWVTGWYILSKKAPLRPDPNSSSDHPISKQLP
jgi:threonine/homoserine efflux transporter RhtA